MEIDIPDLQDLKFEEPCYRCQFGEKDPNCSGCGGTQRRLTPVGYRLAEFLEQRGVKLCSKE